MWAATTGVFRGRNHDNHPGLDAGEVDRPAFEINLRARGDPVGLHASGGLHRDGAGVDFRDHIRRRICKRRGDDGEERRVVVMPPLGVNEVVDVVIGANPPCGTEKIVRVRHPHFQVDGAHFHDPAKHDEKHQQGPQAETLVFRNRAVGYKFGHRRSESESGMVRVASNVQPCDRPARTAG